jgi:hypothetical protein
LYPEIKYELMKSIANERREAAAHHRQVRDAEQRNKSERRSVFGKRRPA